MSTTSGYRQTRFILIEVADDHIDALAESEACDLAFDAMMNRVFDLQQETWTHDAAFGTPDGACPAHPGTTLRGRDRGCDMCDLEVETMLAARLEDDQRRTNAKYAYSSDWAAE